MKMRFLVALLSFASWCAYSQGLDLSLVQLIATPEKYDGHIVVVTGYCSLEFEGTAIYLHQDDERYGHSKNGIWLDVNQCGVWLDVYEKILQSPTLRKTHCIVRGQFSEKYKGHMGLFAGALTNIDHYEAWPPPVPKQKP